MGRAYARRGRRVKWGAELRATSNLTEDFDCRDGDSRQDQRPQGFAAGDRDDIAVPFRPRRPVHADRVGGQGHQPRLRDAGGGVTRDLHVAVALERHIGDLDDQQDILRGGKPGPREAAWTPQDDDIRLRFPSLGQNDGVLYAYAGVTAPASRE